MITRHFLIGALAMLQLIPTLAWAQTTDATENTCFTRVTQEMTEVQDEFRAHIFGSRRDKDGGFTGLAGGRTRTAVTGILETTGRFTSELVSPLVDSYRTYRCKMIAVCATMGESFGVQGGNVDINLLGCEQERLPRYSQCFFSDADAQSGVELQTSLVRMTQQCDDLVVQTLARERAVMRLAVGYDAGYRAMLQLTGMMDWMLQGFETTTVKAVADMVNLLGKLHQIPCFIGQCDLPKTDSLAP
jgi:hypothetical protein